MARDLLTDTAVSPLGDGRYHAEVPDDWNAAVYVFGGVPITVALRAAIAELDAPEYEIRSCNAVFCEPFTAGSLVADVEVLRRGRSARQVSVDLTAADAARGPGMRMTATFGTDSDHTMSFTEPPFPDAPLPDEISEPPVRPGDDTLIPVTRQLEIHSLVGSSPWAHTGPAPARSLRWVRFREPVGDDLPSLGVHADELGLSVMQRREAGEPMLFVISLDIGIHFVDRPHSEWILLDSMATDAGRGFASGIVHLWDTERRLVAVANQRALLKPAPAELDEALRIAALDE